MREFDWLLYIKGFGTWPSRKVDESGPLVVEGKVTWTGKMRVDPLSTQRRIC